MLKPVVTPQVQFLDRLLRLLDKARGDSTGAVLGQGANDRLDGLDSAENCGIPTGAVLGQRCGHAFYSGVQTRRKL